MHPSFQQIVKYRNELTPMEAMKHARIAEYKGRHGKESTAAAIMIFIADLVSAVHVGGKMSEHDIIDITKIIMADYYYLSMAEFAVFCQGAKRGRYGKSFGRMDQMTFFEMFNTFIEEREKSFEEIRAQKKSESQADALMGLSRAIEKVPEIKALVSNIGKPVFEEEQLRREGVKMYPKWMREEVEKEIRQEYKRDQAITDGEIYEKIQKQKEA